MKAKVIAFLLSFCLPCFGQVVILLVVTCKETDGSKEYYPQLPVTSYALKTNGDTLNVVETDAKGGNGRVWKLYLKGDEYYMEWLGVEMLMMSTHQLIDSFIYKLDEVSAVSRVYRAYERLAFCLFVLSRHTHKMAFA